MLKNNYQNIFFWLAAIFFIIIVFPWLIPIIAIVAVGYVMSKSNKFQKHIKSFKFNKAKNYFEEEFTKVKNPMKTFNLNKGKKLIVYAIILLAVFIFLGFAGSFWVIIGAGETGVQSLFGKVRDSELQSGFHIKNPFVKITKMNIRTQEYTMSIAQGEGKKFGSDAIAALTKEGLNVALDITVLYHLEEEKSSDIFRDVGLGYDEIIIRPQIRSVIREVISQYSAKDIYSEKRQEATQKILDELKERLSIRGIEAEEVLLRNIQLPSDLAQSIQEKLQAEQEAERYDFVLQKEEKEAERKRLEATGQRDAQKIINESLTTRYLEFLYIESLKDREGTIYVPTNPNNGTPLFRGL